MTDIRTVKRTQEEENVLAKQQKQAVDVNKMSFGRFLKKDFSKNRLIYLMLLPLVLYYAIFHYTPLYGAIIAFKEYSPSLGILGSPWVGFEHFKEFIEGFYFKRLLINTLRISVLSLLFGFPAPLILALLLNEIKNKPFKKAVQTITYLPHFISLVVVCGMVKDFVATEGVINDFLAMLGMERGNLLSRPELFSGIYVTSTIWQEVGWGSIIYLAALSSIDMELYEAAKVDGAGRLRQTFTITIPGIMPTIIILLLMRMGKMLNVGFEKIILLYNPVTYDTADVISSYVYRKGLQEFNWSFSSAVGLFNSLINFVLIISANMLSSKLNDTSLW